MDTVMARAALEAFADGALSPEDSARMVMHLADCPKDAAYVDAILEANELLAEAYAAPLYQPLPERLRATLFPAGPARTAARTAGRRMRLARIPALVGGALAASLALAVGLGAVSGWRPTTGATTDLAATDAVLRAAFETSPTGPVAEPFDGVDIALIGTFFDGQGRPCREFETVDRVRSMKTQGLACRTAGEGWTTEVAVASRIEAAEARGEIYVPAGGDASGPLDDALDALGAGMNLTAPEEQTLINGGWQP